MATRKFKKKINIPPSDILERLKDNVEASTSPDHARQVGVVQPPTKKQVPALPASPAPAVSLDEAEAALTGEKGILKNKKRAAKTSFTLSEDLMTKLRDYCWWNKIEIIEVVENAISQYLADKIVPNRESLMTQAKKTPGK